VRVAGEFVNGWQPRLAFAFPAMRSAAEIGFRLRQEARNLKLWTRPPELPERSLRQALQAVLPLPAPAAAHRLLAGTRYGENLPELAGRIAAGELPAFDTWIQPGGPIRWRKDYRHGQETAAVYLRRVPYLDFPRAGDHKWVWEINRHQHLVTLAQAWAIDPQPVYSRTIETQLESWLEQNPPLAGINWTSALEVAFRALSWVWIWHWAGAALSAPLAGRLLTALYRHGLYLEANLSVYFSPNTHLLGEALALDTLGRLFPSFPGAARWQETGSRELALALERQVAADGSHFEQSSYYHVYALDMFLLHRVIAGPGTVAAEEKLARMAEFLTVLLGDEGRIPLLGDDDGGRLFSPFGARDTFGRGTLAVYGVLAGGPAPAGISAREASAEMAVWWLGERAEQWLTTARIRPPRQSRLFANAGLAAAESPGTQILADAGPMGPGSAGHSHADALQVLIRRGGRELLIDPGTATYIADPVRRNRFRGTAAHNTVTVGTPPADGGAYPLWGTYRLADARGSVTLSESMRPVPSHDREGVFSARTSENVKRPADGRGQDQATQAGPFRWIDPPEVRLRNWKAGADEDVWDAECRYRNVRHRRLFLWDKTAPRLWIADHVEWDEPGQILPLTQHWQLGEEPDGVTGSTIFCAGARLALEPGGELTIERTERSLVLGQQQASWTAVMRWQSASPARRVTLVDWRPEAGAVRLTAVWDRDSVVIQAQDNPDSPHSGTPLHGILKLSREAEQRK